MGQCIDHLLTLRAQLSRIGEMLELTAAARLIKTA